MYSGVSPIYTYPSYRSCGISFQKIRNNNILICLPSMSASVSKMILPTFRELMSNVLYPSIFSSIPQPILATISAISLFFSIFSMLALYRFNDLPFSFCKHWNTGSRPFFTAFPAESPSTMKYSVLAGSTP